MFLNKKEKPGLKFNQLDHRLRAVPQDGHASEKQGLYPKSERERKIYVLHDTWKEVSHCKSRSRRLGMYQTVCSKCLKLLNVRLDGLVAVVTVVLSFQCLNIVVGEIATPLGRSFHTAQAIDPKILKPSTGNTPYI